ncbi:MAG: hypothetical protein ACREQ5_24980, partial [Candidatus Dormibacteria bacterium]
MIISGTRIPVRATAAAVPSAVRIMRGRIAALTSAVRVRARRPYVPATSCPAVAASPAARARSTI